MSLMYAMGVSGRHLPPLDIFEIHKSPGDVSCYTSLMLLWFHSVLLGTFWDSY